MSKPRLRLRFRRAISSFLSIRPTERQRGHWSERREAVVACSPGKSHRVDPSASLGMTRKSARK